MLKSPPIANLQTVQFSELDKEANIEVYDLMGRIVYKEFISSISSEQVEILKLDILIGGIYNLRIETNNNTYYHKLIKE